MSPMSPYELKIKLDLADDKAKFVKEHSLSSEMNAIVTDDGSMHFFDDSGEDITDSVERIEEWTFSGCKSLIDIAIPGSVKSIGEFAFNGCKSLTDIVIPDSVKSIDSWAFHCCASLKSITIPDSVESIGDHIFYRCTCLTNIVIPDFVKNIGNGAFNWCTSLKNIIFKGKTLEEVQSMDNYPWGVEDESVFRIENSI